MSDDTTIRLIEASLAARSLRSRVIANNIANINTPGFRRGQVQFEQLLEQALRGGHGRDPAKLQPQVVQPMDTPFNDAGSDVSLDQEIGDMVTNSAMYKTYMRVLERLYRQMDMAMAE
jgi:flagellar basal-body rod protein FlgB